MSTKRVYIPFTIFNARITDMRHLWNPSTEYNGQPQKNPSYFFKAIVKKTAAQWWEEPALKSLFDATQALMQQVGMSPQHVNPMGGWPVQDGDVAAPGKEVQDHLKGHWIVGGNSQSAIKVEIVQNGAPVPLANKVNVKPGDVIAFSGTVSQNQQDKSKIKTFGNSVLFLAPGEEIVFAGGNSGPSGSDLMAAAAAQGLNVTGFGSAAAPQSGPTFGGPQIVGSPGTGTGFPGTGTGFPG